MRRPRFSTIGSVFTAVLLAVAILFSGCSDSLTGTTPPDRDQEVTVQQQAQHNQPPNSADTTPEAGHNTSDQD